MKLQEIFLQDINRAIDPVIKADESSLANLEEELQEYVISDNIEKHIEAFLEEYNNNPVVNGVWISGHFGSGKSHLLKMLSIVLEDKQLESCKSSELFLEKLKKLNSPNADLTLGLLERAVARRSRSILFNIDQKADIVNKKTDFDILLSAFLKVFNEECGYYPEQAYIAQFERDLDSENLLTDFISEFESNTGIKWKNEGRERATRFSNEVDQVYFKITGSKQEKILDKYRDDFTVSIDTFAEMVKAFIDKQDKGFRLNFFVDEIGQFIADNTKLMVNLQSLAESLNTKTKGRAWLVVTSQEAVSECVGKFQGHDFSKIQARFAVQLKLNNSDVSEIVQKRVLEKNEAAKEPLLNIFQRYEASLKTLFSFGEGSGKTNKDFSIDEYVNSYPFLPYQYELFQTVIESLSENNAFAGQHKSVGNRTLIFVFQKIAQELADENLGLLVTFDKMYDQIKDLKTSITTTIDNAAKRMDEFTLKVLKILALVRYKEKDFKASVQNISILLIDNLDVDLKQLRIKVQESLNKLENDSYIERQAEIYTYLTNEEKNIEMQIKDTEIDKTELADIFKRTIFDEQLSTKKKISYAKNKQEYDFAIKVDDRLYGRDSELAIHLVTPYTNLTEAQVKTASLNSRELVIQLKEDSNLIKDINIFIQTEKFYKNNYSSRELESHKSILDIKKTQNENRKKDIEKRIVTLCEEANFYVSGRSIELAGELKDIITNGFGKLIEAAYPQLKLVDRIYLETDIKAIANQDAYSEALLITEDMQEVLNFINEKHRNAIRISVKEIVDKFKIVPYGWSQISSLYIIAKLFVNSKLEAHFRGEYLDKNKLADNLLNSSLISDIIITPNSDIQPELIKKFSNFLKDFSLRPVETKDPKALVSDYKSYAEELLSDFKKNYLSQKQKYKFLSSSLEALESLESSTKFDKDYYFSDFLNSSEGLLKLKEENLDTAIKFFNSNTQKEIFDKAYEFYEQNKINISILKEDLLEEMQNLLNDTELLKSSSLKKLKDIYEELSANLEMVLCDFREESLNKLSSLSSSLEAEENFNLLGKSELERITVDFKRIKDRINEENNLANINQILSEFERNTFKNYLTLIHAKEISQRVISDEKIKDEESNSAVAVKVKDEAKLVSQPLMVRVTDLEISFKKKTIKNQEDLSNYLNSIETVIIKEIEKGNIVQL